MVRGFGIVLKALTFVESVTVKQALQRSSNRVELRSYFKLATGSTGIIRIFV